MFDVTTVIFAILAVFVVWKLRSVLGTRTGNEKPPHDPFSRPQRPSDGREAGNDNGNVVRLPGSASQPAGDQAMPEPGANRWAGYAEPGTPSWNGLEAIATAEPGFSPKMFVEGAKAAYEMIVTAFASGDRNTLRNLLAKDVFESFSQAISERESRGEKVQTTFVSIDKASIEDVAVRGRAAQVSVRFQSKLITATTDSAGNIIDGNAEKVVDMIDVWTFTRDLGSRDPNWRLMATDSAH
jgi:predicted lipid-binding transport protein (Tim44 family)